MAPLGKLNLDPQAPMGANPVRWFTVFGGHLWLQIPCPNKPVAVHLLLLIHMLIAIPCDWPPVSTNDGNKSIWLGTMKRTSSRLIVFDHSSFISEKHCCEPFGCYSSMASERATSKQRTKHWVLRPTLINGSGGFSRQMMVFILKYG